LDVEVEKSLRVDYFNLLMKASPLPVACAAALLWAVCGIAATTHAQDAVITKSGLTREGKIVGVSAGNVRLQTAAGTTGLPLAEVGEIRMAAPPEFDAAAAQLASGDAAGAIAALTEINETFAGLPAPWAERASAMLGDAKLAAGDAAGAQAAYDQFRKTYPQATALANLGTARLAVEAGRFDEAGKLLEPVLAGSDKTAFPTAAEGATLSQAHYLMGRVREAGGDVRNALEHYLKASVVFPFDHTATDSARTRADQLRAEHAGLIAP
jgi:tetratricopeptide (TPR) repeat protein